jgi:hypothetical protein
MNPIKTPQGKNPAENIWGQILGPIFEKIGIKGNRHEDSLDMKKRREKEEMGQMDDGKEMSSISHPKLKMLMAQLSQGEKEEDDEPSDEGELDEMKTA